MSYLTRRDGRYSYRRRFPVDVAAAVGRSEFRKALRTSDRTEALKLSRLVSVEFDRLCEQALAGVPAAPMPDRAQGPTDEHARAVMAGLSDVVQRVQLDMIKAMQGGGVHPTYKQELAWMRTGLQAVIDGRLHGVEPIHPLEARAALAAVEAIEAGQPLNMQAMVQPTAPVPAQQPDGLQRVTKAEFAGVLEEYCRRGITAKRQQQVRRLSAEVFGWPSTPAEQIERILAHCQRKLQEGTKPASLSTSTSAMLAVLRCIPGWDSIKLPKTNTTARAVRAGAGADVESRDPVPLSDLRTALGSLQASGKACDYAAALLLARYGLRPSELLREGMTALAMRTDIMGAEELVFQAGLTARKNASSRRDLPVHADDVPLFKLVLSDLSLPANASPAQLEERTIQRVRRLHDQTKRRLPMGLTLYSIRHTCADLLRHCGASESEVGDILGHSQGNQITSAYGGKAVLQRRRELLEGLRALIQPDAVPAVPA